MSDRPLDAGDITALLGEVADELSDDAGRRIVVVGGALLALHGLREATRDVDSTTIVDEDLRDAVARVAARHGLAPAWLNDRARMFLPVTFDEAECEVLVVLEVGVADVEGLGCILRSFERAVLPEDLEVVDVRGA